MVLKIYGHPLSEPSRTVHIFAQMAEIEHEYILIDLIQHEQRLPGFLAINPLGQVPAISDGDFKLGESHAILTYLAITRQVEDHWYPIDPQRRALVDRYLHWHHGNLRKAGTVVFAKVYAPMIGASVPEAIVEEAEETRLKAFAQLEAWLTANTYLVGPEMSIADLSAMSEVVTHSLVDFDMSPYPHVQAWLAPFLANPIITEAHRALTVLKAQLVAKKQEASA